MPYIGNTPADKFLTLAKQNFSTSATTSYTLDSAVSSTQDIALFINNVRQSPVDAYSVSGTALTLTSATAGTDEMYCVYLGKTVGTVVPGSNTITNAMMTDDSVGLVELSATGTPSSSNFLRGDNSWASAGLDGVTTGSGNVTITNGNLVLGTAGKGIDFSATSGTGTSEILDDYEEGTWSPALSNFGGSSESFIDPRYTKVGRLVTVSMQLQIGSFPSDGSAFAISGLPFTVKSGSGTTYGTVPFRQTNTTTMGLTFGGNNTVIEMYEVPTGGQFNYNDFGQSKQMAFVATYETDS